MYTYGLRWWKSSSFFFHTFLWSKLSCKFLRFWESHFFRSHRKKNNFVPLQKRKIIFQEHIPTLLNCKSCRVQVNFKNLWKIYEKKVHMKKAWVQKTRLDMERCFMYQSHRVRTRWPRHGENVTVEITVSGNHVQSCAFTLKEVFVRVVIGKLTLFFSFTPKQTWQRPICVSLLFSTPFRY